MKPNKSYLTLIEKAKEAIESNQIETAIQCYQEAFLLEIQSQDLMDYGYLHMDLEKYALAREIFLSLLDIKPDEKEAYYALGLIYEELHMTEDAKQMYLAALAIDSNYIQCLFNLANLFVDENNLTEAKERFHQILSIEEKHYWTNLNLGSIYEQENELELAKTHTLKAKEADNTKGMVHYNLGVIYTKEGKYSEAIAAYKEELTKNAPYELTFRNLALLYKDIKAFREAKEVLLKGIKNQKDDVSLWYNLGCIYAIEMNFQDAYEAFVIAVSLNYQVLIDIPKDIELKDFIKSKEFIQLIAFFKK